MAIWRHIGVAQVLVCLPSLPPRRREERDVPRGDPYISVDVPREKVAQLGCPQVGAVVQTVVEPQFLIRGVFFYISIFIRYVIFAKLIADAKQ